ncbi:MAG: ATP-binding protein [Bacteroidetes bacterium]|nr:ATP-binding protein [Bacteroidota bacterium]
MNKDLLKKIIIENQERIPGLKVFPRGVNISDDTSTIITGPRRAGKTYMLYGTIQQLLEKGNDISEILYINFEDERLLEMSTKDLDTILESYKELYNKTPFIFLDEIQNINAWQKFARRLADTGYMTMITGSNAQMLSADMASTLGGRYMIREIDTLSFSEYLQFQGIHSNENTLYTGTRFEIQQHFEDYFTFGGFPELYRISNKKEYLSNIFQKIFLGDIIARYQIRNSHALKIMVKKLAESTMDEVSYRRIRNIVQSTGIAVGTNTLIEYINYFKEAFLMNELNNFGAKISSRETKKKFYFRDHGLLTLFLQDPDSALLETLVYNHLRSKHSDQLYYLRNNYEVDFMVPGVSLTQVAYSLTNNNTKTRELQSLKKAAEALNIGKLQIITKSEEEQIELDDKKVDVIPVWKWLLE